MKRRVVVLLPLVLVPRRAEAALALVRCNVNWMGGEDGAVAADVEEEEGRTPEDGACVESARREAAAARVAGLMIDLMVCFVVSLLCLVVVASGVDGLSSIERRRLLSLWLRVTGGRLKLGGGVCTWWRSSTFHLEEASMNVLVCTFAMRFVLSIAYVTQCSCLAIRPHSFPQPTSTQHSASRI